MIIVTNKQNQTAHYDDKLLPDICFKICGSGMTVKNTADAMELQTKIRLNGIAKNNGYTIELVEQ